eukprot:CAMPEP_0174372976 /NCGR_PEP_ID=MMETSP0811_2-20130205/105391_1 /TAXON_ID=73025 ORGANISM="Eutreptiella gymnastica-like, Strain CCMP1594" /NCGR_SAMPLE_ID=MMETSP0811_2 /ASSEMBLY_ACC=CAM_ASM_000667 /LENGTH=45 /DNA_ID= /DNA_START= /DNA_END= /DNA_ORIENTATION=
MRHHQFDCTICWVEGNEGARKAAGIRKLHAACNTAFWNRPASPHA